MSQLMKRKSRMLLAFVAIEGLSAAAGCAGAAPAPTKSAAGVGSMRATAPVATAAAAAPETGAATPREILAQAERAEAAQLGASRGEQFEVDRQVAVLQQAVLLYKQFLERAEGRPELEPAVRKSRERIADVQQTIDFLLGRGSAGATR
jgi:hypothetical protein